MINNVDNKKILKWHLWGTAFLILVGSLLHFAFEWSNYSLIVGALTPVNESVWEHLKLGFTSLLIFSIFEYPNLKNYANNYFIAKASGIIVFNLIIVLLFYLYTSIAGHSILILDISLYVAGCILCQIISYKFMCRKSFPKSISLISIVFIILQLASFIIFTFNPPRLPIFMDSKTKSYGIVKD
ncbi:hypothetical protein Q428_11060 [Fervidicella metallireducens AeB]|uniref:Uncharacterized protein n=1 Tax=Fervidicella metallireducens AeB TaxID=1403537 RepID=A0A017RVA7_9CLOT|nr:DUF6512 family protein [Fervidicella metallireducens]EYE87845.1 hypothetical protein Q428_11060 [Fervidicella metallireducens AeB]